MKVAFFLFIFNSILSLPLPLRAEERMTLEQFLNEAKGQNLSLKVEGASVSAARENAVGLAIPPPMAGITQLRDQSGNANGFEVNQTIPFPSKLTNDYSARQFEADAQGATRKSSEKEILAQAKLLYFQIWQSQERTAFLIEKKSAIQQHIKLATAGARSDSFLKIHLIKAENDLDLLENELLQANQDNRERQIQAALLLNRDPKTSRLTAQEIPISTLLKEESLASPYQLEAKKFRLESMKAREREMDSSWLPDFNLRYREMGGTQMNPRYSEIMIGASLPFVFFWEPLSSSKKGGAERLKAELELDQEKRKVDAERTSLLARAESLKKQLDQFKEKLIPRAEKRMRLVHNLAPRDMETLQDHRETMEALPDLKLKALELREQYEKTVAELEKYSSEGSLK